MSDRTWIRKKRRYYTALRHKAVPLFLPELGRKEAVSLFDEWGEVKDSRAERNALRATIALLYWSDVMER